MTQVVYWRQKLPPLSELLEGEHEIDAESSHVHYDFGDRPAMWKECYGSLSTVVENRIRHLRVAVTEFVEHYHQERNHQGLDNRLLTNRAAPANHNAPILRRERLGGLLNFYFRRAS